MLQEVREQPAALERTLAGELRNVEELRERFRNNRPSLIVLVARGTSDNAAQFGRYLLEMATGIPVSLAAPSIVTLYQRPPQLRGALVVAVSQSGESTDTNRVLEQAKADGAMTVGITNEAGSTLARIAGHTILVRAGKELSVAATKTYTGQLLAMYLLAYALGAPVELDTLRRLPAAAESALSLEEQVGSLATGYRDMQKAVVAGRGLNYSNAFELALKLMETCYVVAERFSPADFLHGPIAILDRAFPVFLFAPAGVTWTLNREVLERFGQTGAKTLVITDRGNAEAASAAHGIVIPADLNHTGDLPVDVYTPIPYIIPGQLLAAHLAVAKGLNPDQPRTLSKVTKTL